jgi:Protein of unknown function (DUF2452)
MASDHDSKEPEAERASGRAMMYPTSRLGAKIELVDLAREIEKADETIGLVVSGKLDTIREQMRALQDQARRLLEEARDAARLHRAACNFKKTPGKVYHLYRRGGGELYFSMLSPEDWRGSPPHPFEGSYRLEADLSFSLVGEGPEREHVDARPMIRSLLAEGDIRG